MTSTKMPQKLTLMRSFKIRDFIEAYQDSGCKLGEAALRKKMQCFEKTGEIVRVGRGVYCVPTNESIHYEYRYSKLSCDVADMIKEKHPYLDFTIFELIQLNEFVNHQLAHNVVFLAVEDATAEFVFDTLKETYPGKVLLHPTSEIYHQYWYDNMIVIGRLVTEAPKGLDESWHTRIEKMLVDLMVEPLLKESVSDGEYPTIYEDAFKKYVIDESCMFRYAKRRNADKRIRKFIKEQTTITLRTKE